MNDLIKSIKNILFALLTIWLIFCLSIIPFQLNALIEQIIKLQQIEIEIYKRESQRINKL